MALSLEDHIQRITEASNGLQGFPPQQTEELLKRLQTMEIVLSQIEQNPPQVLLDAVSPLMSTLTSHELFSHTDMDVKASVTACVTELMRISAPEAPYSDDQFKVVFQMTVAVLEQLSLPGGHSYQKAVSILLVIAKIRSPIILLDIECDALILAMFNHFLTHIRSDHSEDVFLSMAAIMMMIIKESDTIPSDLLSLLLSSVRKENQETSPMTLKLGEKVITECANTLECHVVNAVMKGDINLNDYTEIVDSIFRSGSSASENNAAGDDRKENLDKKDPAKDAGPSKSGQTDAGPAKMDEPDPLPGKAKQTDSECVLGASEPFIPGKDKSEDEPDSVPRRGELKQTSLLNDEEGHQKQAHSVGVAEPVSSLPIEDDKLETEMDSAPTNVGVKRKSLKIHDEGPHGKDKSGGASELNNSAAVDAEEADKNLESVSKQRGPKRRYLRRQDGGHSERADLGVASDTLIIREDDHTDVQMACKTSNLEKVESGGSSGPKSSLSTEASRSERGLKPNSLIKGYERASKKYGGSSSGSARQRKAATPSNFENVTDQAVDSKSEANEAAAASVSEDPKPADATTQPRRCSQKSKVSELSEADAKTPAVLKENEANAQAEKKTSKIVIKMKKEPEVSAVAEENLTVLRRSTRLCVTAEKNKESAGKTVQRKEEAEPAVKSEAVDIIESSSGPRSSRRRKRSDSENKNTSSEREAESSKGRGKSSMLKKSRVIGKEETSESPDLGFGLVGRSIMVWWPIDRVYYEGVVHSYDPEKKKHAVHYIDGDVEILNLKTQKWAVLGSDPLPTEGQMIELVGLDAPPSPTPVDRKGKKKLNLEKQAKEATTDSSSESDSQNRSRRTKASSSRGSSGRSQLRGKAKSVKGKEVKIYEESKDEHSSSMESYPEKVNEDIELDGSMKSFEEIESDASLDKFEEKEEAADEDEGLNSDDAMDVFNSEDASKSVKEATPERAPGKSSASNSELGTEECTGTLAEMSKGNAKNKKLKLCSSSGSKKKVGGRTKSKK